MTADDIAITAGPAGVRIDIRVIPRASRSAIAGVRAGRLLVRVNAPPVDGAANAAVLEVMAEAAGVPRRAVSILTGDSHREKTVLIVGITEAQARDRFSPKASRD